MPSIPVRVLRHAYYAHGPGMKARKAEELKIPQSRIAESWKAFQRVLGRKPEVAVAYATAEEGIKALAASWVPESPEPRRHRGRDSWDTKAAGRAMGCSNKAATATLQKALHKVSTALKAFPEAETIEGRQALAGALFQCMEQRALAAQLQNIAEAAGAPVEDVVRVFHEVRRKQHADDVERNRQAEDCAGADRGIRDWEGLRCPFDS
jgi:hypothetical protein